MVTLIFGDYVYETPIFMVKALTRKDLPEAFEQLEKLRRSGYLAGFVRWDAVSPVPEQPVQPDPRFEQTPYVNFMLFRHRRPLALQPKAPCFCPELAKGLDRAWFARRRSAVLEADPRADVVLSEELQLETACEGRLIFESLAASRDVPYRGFFKDAFEEVICLSGRRFLEASKEGAGKPEILRIDAPEADRDCLAAALAGIAEPGTVEAGEGELSCQWRQGLPVKAVFDALFPAVQARGRTGTPEQIFGHELRARGIYGGVFGVFSIGHTELALVERSLEKRPGDQRYRLAAGGRVNAAIAEDEAWEQICAPVRWATLPEGTVFEEAMRLEGGAVFMLEAHLKRIQRQLVLHGMAASWVDPLLEGLAPCEARPSPGQQGRLAPEALASQWARLPEAWREELAGRGASLEGPCELVLTADAGGRATLAARPLSDAADARLGLSRKALDERSDYLAFATAYHPWFDKAFERIQAGECFDVLFVNRLGLAASGARSALVFEQDGVLVTPPLKTGMKNDVLRQALVDLKAVEERDLPLQEVLQMERAWCVSAVYGAVEASIEKPRRPRG